MILRGPLPVACSLALPAKLGTAICTGLMAAGIAGEAKSADVRFEEVSVEAGVRSVHNPLGYYDRAGNPFQNAVGQGAAFIDLNRDGWLDLVVTNGTVPGNFIYLNDGDGTFTEISDKIGLRKETVTNGVVFGDLNNDGFGDIFFTNHIADPDVYIGGPLRFQRQSNSFGMNAIFFQPGDEPDNWDGPLSMAAALGDYDNDGYLDLYMANFLFAEDVLLHNEGGVQLRNTHKVQEPALGYGCMAMWFDYDDDGDQDIFVVNDLGVDFLFRNDGPESGWQFTEYATGVKVAGGSDETRPLSMGMGIAIGDYDNDLDLDIYITNFRRNALWDNPGNWQNAGRQRFSERAQQAGVAFPLNSWGADFFDVDNDGYNDLFMVGGWIPDGPDHQPREITNKLWLNNGDPQGAPEGWTFRDVTEEAGLDDMQYGKSQAVGDYDRDGDLDIFVTNTSHYDPAPDFGTEPTLGHTLLYRNDTESKGHWVSLRLTGGGPHDDGTGCNRDAVGCRTYVTAGGQTQMRVVQAGSGYLGQNSLELEFGLGEATSIDEVKVRWTCGAEEIFDGVEVDGFYRLEEGEGQAEGAPLALSRFEARSTTDGVLLEWWGAPSQRFDDVRFYRAASTQDDFERIEPSFSMNDGVGSALDKDVRRGETYRYRIVLKSQRGASTTSLPSEVTFEGNGSTPPDVRPTVGQNFPNPFNPHTTILVSLPRPMDARLVVYDARGRKVRGLYEGPGVAGEFPVDWDGRDDTGQLVSTGVYYYTLYTEEGTSSRKLSLVR